jgi:AraC-like DNA-binding protein
MPKRKPSASGLSRVLKLKTPRDYFAETRSSSELWPEKILCFTRRNRGTESDPLARHHHHRYVLVVPWRRSGEVHVDDQRFLLENPHALLIFPFQFHHGFDFRKQQMAWLFITFEVRDGAILEALRLQPYRRLARDDFGLLSNLAEAWNSARKEELAHWLALILKRLLCAPAPKRGFSQKGPQGDGSLLIRINQQCIPRLHQLFGLKELAARLSMSESYLRARFRRATGLSLGQHLKQLRFQKAMGLLVQSSLTITQIAERCGFDSVFTFSRSFHRFSGMTARAYRLQFGGRSFGL